MKLKNYLFYLLIFALSLLLRLYKIDYLPSVISHDEVFYVAQAQALATNGRGLNGQWQPFSLSPESSIYAELPGAIMAPAAKIWPQQPVLAARVTHAVLGSILVLILAALSYRLSRNRLAALSTALVAAVNPWLFQFSRMSFDALLSLFFYCLGLLLLLGKKPLAKLLSLPILILGFFQYQGLKIIFLPLVVMAVLFNLFKNKSAKTKGKVLNKIWPDLVVLLFSVLLFAVYLFKLPQQSASERLNFLIFNDRQYIEQTLSLKKQQSLKSPISDIYPNKITIIAERFIDQYINSLDIKQWFVALDVVRNPFATYQHGLFYYLDLILIVIGLIAIWTDSKHRAEAYLITGLLLIAPLPAAVVSTDSWPVFRVSFLVPIALILIGRAWAFLLEHWRKYLLIPAFLAYALLVASYLYHYFYVYPIAGTTDQYFAEKLVAQYIKRNPEQKIVVIAPEPIFVFSEILVYNNLINQDNIQTINQAYQTKDYQLANIQVLGERCVPNDTDADTIYLAHRNVGPCEGEPDLLNGALIASLLDSGVVYRIYNDQLCQSFSLSRFIHIQDDLFDLDQLSNQQFCQNFIIRH